MTTETPTAMPPYGIRNGTTLEQPPDQSSRTPKGKILSEFYFRETALDRSIALQWFNQAINRPHQGGIIGDNEFPFVISDCCKNKDPIGYTDNEALWQLSSGLSRFAIRLYFLVSLSE